MDSEKLLDNNVELLMQNIQQIHYELPFTMSTKYPV